MGVKGSRQIRAELKHKRPSVRRDVDEGLQGNGLKGSSSWHFDKQIQQRKNNKWPHIVLLLIISVLFCYQSNQNQIFGFVRNKHWKKRIGYCIISGGQVVVGSLASGCEWETSAVLKFWTNTKTTEGSVEVLFAKTLRLQELSSFYFFHFS